MAKKFAFLPNDQSSNGASPLEQVVTLYLRKLEWQSIKGSDEKPDLLVIMSCKDDALDFDDLLFLSRYAMGDIIAILVFDMQGHLTQLPFQPFERVFVVPCKSFPSDAPLKEWLHKLPSVHINANNIPTFPRLDGMKKLIQEFTNPVSMELKGNQDFGWCSTYGAITDLLKQNDLYLFYYKLVRISGKYDTYEHELNKHLYEGTSVAGNLESQPKQGDLKKYHYIHLVRSLINTCNDISFSLRAQVDSAFTAANGQGSCILVIDDNPETFKEQIISVMREFLPSYRVLILNPQNQWELFQHILQYDSLSFNKKLLSNDTKLHLEEYGGQPNERLQKNLREIQQCCSHILVDILYRFPDGRDESLGPNLIQRLVRIFRDLSGDDSGKSLNVPTIIAFSRAEDTEKISACLQSGASSYLLKSRLLSLPGILMRVQRSAFENTGNFHQNFRSLYALPPRVIDKIKRTRVPGIDLHQGCANITPQNTIEKTVNGFAEFLTLIPKPDLHVHAGSLMTTEFLAVAAPIMLSRYSSNSSEFCDIKRAISIFFGFWGASQKLYLHRDLYVLHEKGDPSPFSFKDYAFGVRDFANDVRTFLTKQIKRFRPEARMNDLPNQELEGRYYIFRSILHKSLGVPDFWDEDRAISKLNGALDYTLFFFAMAFSACKNGNEYELVFKKSPKTASTSDVLRIFILFLAKKEFSSINVTTENDKQGVSLNFDQIVGDDGNQWTACLYEIFFATNGPLSYQEFRKNGWKLRGQCSIQVNRRASDDSEPGLVPTSSPNYAISPLTYLLSTGTRSTSLKTYLEGCELSGSEHLRHPFLIHLYAQHVVHQLVRMGVLYAELRAAISGYELKDFDFSFGDACDCLLLAFTQAQGLVFDLYKHLKSGQKVPADSDNTSGCWLWDSPFNIKHAFHSVFRGNIYGFTVKVGVILTGKRHKPSREMLREAAGAMVRHSRPMTGFTTAAKFAEEQVTLCRLVGFDLAGDENEFPPELFRTEFEQLGRLHIPITAHAGENANSGYVERAVLDLRARRLGHGLAISDDYQLMVRVREDHVCVELCPVSNFQTSRFVPAKSLSGREYPLRKLFENGNSFCINTDNPAISQTNIIRECFQASYAFGVDGLSLWDLMCILRMGFIHSFMSMPERRAILEIADQILYDLFSMPVITTYLAECLYRKGHTQTGSPPDL